MCGCVTQETEQQQRGAAVEAEEKNSAALNDMEYELDKVNLSDDIWIPSFFCCVCFSRQFRGF